MKPSSEEPTLPFHWQKVQSAIWLIGIGFLIWTGWWIPGIFILIAISGLTQAYFANLTRNQEEQAQAVVAQKTLETTRAVALPPNCPSCGAGLTATSVIWRSATTASCPYCNTAVKAVPTPPAAPPPPAEQPVSPEAPQGDDTI
jgi:hypothetical protein